MKKVYILSIVSLSILLVGCFFSEQTLDFNIKDTLLCDRLFFIGLFIVGIIIFSFLITKIISAFKNGRKL
ncbi:hypothetical protein GCM10022258_20930 [Aquimarina gracilis]